jgi:hypothetical protein
MGRLLIARASASRTLNPSRFLSSTRISTRLYEGAKGDRADIGLDSAGTDPGGANLYDIKKPARRSAKP